MKLIAVLVLAIAASACLPAESGERQFSCTLEFDSTQWSVLYEHAQGAGKVTCDNGKHMYVDIVAKGVGITAGKWKIEGGKGRFTRVERLYDLLGSYAALSVNAGIVKAGTAQALTNGKVSLVLAGSGDGIDAGVTISKFTIERSPGDDGP